MFYWLGNGATYDELHDDGDCAWYLDDSYIDYPASKHDDSNMASLRAADSPTVPTKA